jgi:hypothetical protein
MTKLPPQREFTVRGSDLFPFDMLRYDQCWPKSQDDTAAMERTTRRRGGMESRGPVEITLMTYSESRPTVPRWESFNWIVVRG